MTPEGRVRENPPVRGRARAILEESPLQRGLSSFTAIFIIFLALAAVLFYYRRSIQKRTPPVAPAQKAGPVALPVAPAPAVRELLAPPQAYRPQTAPAAEPGLARASELNAKALEEFKAGNLREAEALLEQAVASSNEETFSRNLAAVKIKLGDLEGAAPLLAEHSDDPTVRRLLKNVYVTLGNEAMQNADVTAAAGYYEKGAKLDPEDASLTAVLAKLKRDAAAESGMRSTEGGHFIVKYEGGENATAGHLIGILLEEAYMKVGSDFDYYPAHRITALLYSQQRFRDITRTPAWSGAIYDGRIKLPAGGVFEKTDELERVIFHEYTHAVVHMLAKGRAPVWLNEGLAMYEEGRDAGEFAPYLRDLAGTGKLNLRPLEGSFMGLGAEQARTAYILSLSATRYIIDEYGLASVKRILDDLGRGMNVDSAVQDALYISYDELQKDWARTLLKG